MKRFTFIKLLVASIALGCLSGCETIKTWWNDLSLTDVAKTLSPTIQAAAKYTVYAVVDNNPELKPIFIASANGVKAAITANAYDTTQIKQYIADALGEKNAKWTGVVYAAMDTILVQYEIIYNKYINSAIESSDKANGFRIILDSVVTGMIDGVNLELPVASNVKAKTIETKRLEANESLRVAIQKL